MKSAPEQLSLLAVPEPTEVQPGWFTGLPPKHGGARYTHLMRAEGDPERAERGTFGATDWKKVGDLSPAQWARRITDHLADGEPRTFNRIAVELTGFTADVVFEENLDHGLWHAVEQGRVLWTPEAPVLFRSARK